MNPLAFRGTTVAFATNHGKAHVAAEPFKRILGTTVTELAIDSDTLGTFTGEVERPGSKLDALRGKVQLARQRTAERFVLVSEGSFSAAQGLGLIAQGIEMLLLHDAVTGSEVIEQYVTVDTNYATGTLSTQHELERFLKAISFGTHALVLYPQGIEPRSPVFKGITTLDEAVNAFATCREASPEGTVTAMSDMRAHHNPTRMRAIGACCELLAHRLATPCPTCGSGGFGLVSLIPGLPCEWCGSPTSRAKAEKHACVVCHATAEMPRKDGQQSADPGECPFCNP